MHFVKNSYEQRGCIWLFLSISIKVSCKVDIYVIVKTWNFELLYYDLWCKCHESLQKDKYSRVIAGFVKPKEIHRKETEH